MKVTNVQLCGWGFCLHELYTVILVLDIFKHFMCVKTVKE